MTVFLFTFSSQSATAFDQWSVTTFISNIICAVKSIAVLIQKPGMKVEEMGVDNNFPNPHCFLVESS
jgi:hypothetical protein